MLKVQQHSEKEEDEENGGMEEKRAQLLQMVDKERNEVKKWKQMVRQVE